MTTALRFGIACAPFPGIRIGSVLPVMSLRISASSNSVAIAPVDEEMTLGRVRCEVPA